jgi:hypothetical protein
MTEAYRNNHEAALQQIEILREENQALREQLEHAQPPCPHATVRAPNTLPVLLAGLFFLAGSVTLAGAISARHSRAGCTSASWVESQRAALRRAEQLSSPGSIRVEGLADIEDAQVFIDGVLTARSGGIAFSGPLMGHQAHRVTVNAPGYLPFSTVMSVAPATTHGIFVTLIADPRVAVPIESLRDPWAAPTAAIAPVQ